VLILRFREGAVVSSGSSWHSGTSEYKNDQRAITIIIGDFRVIKLLSW
jgi:hypothetical protein